MLHRSWFPSVKLAVLFLFGFTASAFAATAAVDDGSLLDLAKPILQSVRDGHGWIAAAAGLILLSTAARRYLAPRYAFFLTPLGGIVIVFSGAYGSAVLVALAAAGTTTLTAALAFTALKVALTAAGGYAALRPLLVDLVEPFLLAQFPYLKPILDLLTWAFDKPNTVTDTATTAGNAAVAANPAPGVAAVAGKTTEIE